MNRLVDVARSVFISPEIVCLGVPVAIWLRWPESLQFIATQINSDFKWGIGVEAIPIALLTACFNLSSNILSPSDARKVLLDWPDYWMLKNRVLIALGYCVLAIAVTSIGFYMVATNNSSFGIAMIFSGCLSAAASLATVALAWWRSREILGA